MEEDEKEELKQSGSPNSVEAFESAEENSELHSTKPQSSLAPIVASQEELKRSVTVPAISMDVKSSTILNQDQDRVLKENDPNLK